MNPVSAAILVASSMTFAAAYNFIWIARILLRSGRAKTSLAVYRWLFTVMLAFLYLVLFGLVAEIPIVGIAAVVLPLLGGRRFFRWLLDEYVLPDL